MSERLLHYSRTGLCDKPYPLSNGGHFDYKPKGLWVSVQGPDDWQSWCESEEFRIEHLDYPHEVTLEKDANILRLCGSADLQDFQHRYGRRDPETYWRYTVIDWGLVSQAHQGIIIAPYVWAQRLEMMWYYGWDCASGCIWDTSAIRTVQRLYLDREVSGCEEACVRTQP